jgi:hypothetical protein
MLKDTRDPDFIRYVFTNTNDAPLECATGKASDAEQIMVNPGEFFTVSSYAALPLDDLLGLECMLQAKDKVDTSTSGREVWRWRLVVPPETKKQLANRRETAALAAGSAPAQLPKNSDPTSAIQ